MANTANPEIHIYNTLSGKKEKFAPLNPQTVTIYSCGPTVYGLTHVGNARAALVPDLVVKTLRLAGYSVEFARNITDIDDKIIKVAQSENISWQEVVNKFTKAYHSDLDRLGVVRPLHEPKATETIQEMILFIETLIKKDAAYVAETPFGNDVYFKVSSFGEYGKLSKRKLEDMKTGVRIETGESKTDPLDFALWKAAKPGEPFWKSPWGEGRPGWHIECSAMIEKVFQKGIDIHMGGIDLIFPHHENEIAQSESCKHGALARYWIHNGLLNFGKEKMSKSLGNIFTTEKFLDLYGPKIFRLMCLQHHYRGPMEFGEEGILRAEGMIERLFVAIRNYNKAKAMNADKSLALSKLGNEYLHLANQIEAPLFDDFNTAKGIGIIYKTIRALNKLGEESNWIVLEDAVPTLKNVFGLLGEDSVEVELDNLKSRRLKRLGITKQRADEIENLLNSRDIARKNKEFDKSDRIRADIESQGILIMDGPDGSTWTIKG